jgi:hypothetical protein
LATLTFTHESRQALVHLYASPQVSERLVLRSTESRKPAPFNRSIRRNAIGNTFELLVLHR